MESYVETILYAYPRLKGIGRDYEDHIRNKGILSYDYRVTTERLAEYLAEEILEKAAIENLQATVESVLKKLTKEEMLLLEMRYFRRKSRLQEYGPEIFKRLGSLRNYYRKQGRVLKKVSILFRQAGLTEENFFREYSRFNGLTAIYRYIESGAAAEKEKARLTLFKEENRRLP